MADCVICPSNKEKNILKSAKAKKPELKTIILILFRKGKVKCEI